MVDDHRPGYLRLALYSGLCIRHDAISDGLRLKLEAADRWRAAGYPITVSAFVHSTDYDDPRIREVDRVSTLLRASEFRAANVHVFEFGIYYPLFDAVFAVPSAASVIGIYHNVTPPELADDAATRAVLERSMVQRHNLSRADHVVTHSNYSREQLLALGFEPDRVSVIPLPPGGDLVIEEPVDPTRSGVVELLYVGRFVRSKGVLDLLAAAESLVGTAPPFRLTLAGNPTLSSAAVLDEVRRRCEGDLSGVARLVLAPDTQELAALYRGSDIFVIPSYHEGYCVPVVEALASGCHVVAYDSSNLPFVLSGLGSLVRTGDVAMLAATLRDSIERFSAARARGVPIVLPTSRGDLDEATWRNAVRAHLESCSTAEFEARWLGVLERVTRARAELVTAGVG